VQRKALEIIAECSVPVSIDFVAFHCKISWGTARALLMSLVADRKLNAQRTTKGWIFFVGEEGQNRQVERPKAQFNPVAKEESDPS